MRIAKALVVAATLLGFGVAHADEVVRVERRHSTAGIVLKDTIAGGLVGSAVSGGVILYNMGIQGDDNYDWGRTLAWGAVIGLGAGLVWGIVDAASASDTTYAARTPVHDGQSLTLNRGRDQSNKVTMGLLSRRF
ncbi:MULTISPECIES: hypothetical protein [unclassified Anaeromyxobacter]|uniref:hypothetical protein n=1 Tax=unclassified Anaeromyxobacter TaxID=2620896 RepID=UPI001F57D6BE|nr:MULTISPECIES: hypothetical protein [unclassified Anaeromyxobacter]